MIATLPAVQGGCRHLHRYVRLGAKTLRYEKRNANRRHRRYLNRATRRIQFDPELWYGECFDAPSLSTWDLW